MLELAKLTNGLDVGEGQGIDTLDPRFQDIASLIEQADFAAAALKCQETFEELGGDIRLIAWFYFGLVLQDGIPVLGPVLEQATTIFRDRLDAVGPERKKDRHATSGMSWFLSKLADRVTSDDPDLEAEAAAMMAKATLEDVQAALAAVNELWQVFPEAVPTPDPTKVTNHLRRLREWLETQEAALTPAAVPEAPEPVEAEEEESGDDGPSDISLGGGAAPSGGLQVDASPQLAQLQARIAAFELLMKHGDVTKAAVIASDVMAVVNNFDPRVYLPRLFGGFFAQFANCADQVLDWQEKRGTAPWAIYDQLYRTDLDAFIRSSEGGLQRMLNEAAPAPVYAPPPQAAPAYQQPQAALAPPPAPAQSAQDNNSADDDDDDDW